MPRDSFDYVVIGSGSAGSVLAARLSQDSDVDVLLLEAGGPDAHEDIHNPLVWPTLIGTELDWGYWTTPQLHANHRKVHCPRGKMLGGCASHNAMAWVRGDPRDYDRWGEDNPGWDAETARKIFKGFEDYAGGENEYRGIGGPLYMTPNTNPNPIAKAFVDGAQQVGIRYVEDYNAGPLEGVSFFDLLIKDGRRNSTVRAFLDPARVRQNLHIQIDAEVTRLNIRNGRCTGVSCTVDGRTRTVRATETILSAGAIGSPKLLLLSGIGPEQDLRDLDIPVTLDLPGVGENLQDHILLAGVNYECNGDLPAPHGNAAESTLWWKSDSSLDRSDTQPVVLEFPFVTPELAHDIPPNTYAIAPSLVRPKSRGTVKLTSNDPSKDPAIDMNYLGHADDVKAILACLELCRDIGASDAFDELRKREIMPGDLDADAKAEFARMSVTTYFHPTSSCKMGRDDLAVVDAELRVRGIDGLRIADASIMPEITTGNTHAPAMLIGEMAARLLGR